MTWVGRPARAARTAGTRCRAAGHRRSPPPWSERTAEPAARCRPSQASRTTGPPPCATWAPSPAPSAAFWPNRTGLPAWPAGRCARPCLVPPPLARRRVRRARVRIQERRRAPAAGGHGLAPGARATALRPVPSVRRRSEKLPARRASGKQRVCGPPASDRAPRHGQPPRLLGLLACSRAGVLVFWDTHAPVNDRAPPAAARALAPALALIGNGVLLTVAAGPAVEYTRAAAEQVLEPQAYMQAVLGAQTLA